MKTNEGRLVVFKVVGTETSCAEYMKAAAAQGPVRQSSAEWAGFYFQLNARHALGTIGYRFDCGYKRARLLEVVLGTIELAMAHDPDKMMAKNLPGDVKAAWAKEALGLDAGRPLMEQLGEKRQCLLCLETDSEMELVMPLSLVLDEGPVEPQVQAVHVGDALVERCIVSERLVCEFAPNTFGVVAKMRWAGSDEWALYDEKAFGVNSIPGWATAIAMGPTPES
jgi:hypothetical protein